MDGLNVKPGECVMGACVDCFSVSVLCTLYGTTLRVVLVSIFQFTAFDGHEPKFLSWYVIVTFQLQTLKTTVTNHLLSL